ncbi:MAG: response regulator [Ignavibacteriales bacterium]|nr:response regulator [Ignavibacteriales bacterium]
MTGTKLDLLIKLNELSHYARSGDEFLPDEICNFLSNEFDLNGAALFSIGDNNSFHPIGKSAGVKKNQFKGNFFSCPNCTHFSGVQKNTLIIDTNCSIQISDNISNEGCYLISLSDLDKMVIKVAKKTYFHQNDKDNLEKAIQLVSSIILLWIEKRGGTKHSTASFARIVTETTNELKASSNNIISLTSPLQTENITPLKKYAQNILLNINDLNEISKIETNSVTRNQKSVELVLLINEIVELFKSNLGNRKITFSVSIDKLLDKSVILDDHKLRYILSSLLYVSTNLTHQGEISVTASVIKNNLVKFVINDSGTAIESKMIDKLYDPFTLFQMAEFRNSPLAGLSLTLVKKYVHYLGGEISTTSEAGIGNTFTFTINGEVMADIENSISQLPKPTSLNKVLVIEDDYATSKLLTNYLTKWGYNPTIVGTEEQAFSVINKEPLLAIILDIELPNVNGLELLKKLHDNPQTKNTPVIVCSIEPEQQKAFMMGAVEYFIKPINYNYLVEVLTSYKLRKNSNVLCVDDDEPTLILVKQAIESAGFIAIAENVSANVMDRIKDKDIDLAIVDLDMPAPNGFDLIKLIKSDKKFAHLPIIIYTGKENYREDLYKIEGLFEELLDKRSTNIEDLADTISAMINRYETPPTVEEVMHKDNVIKILLAEDYKHSQIIVTRLLKKNDFENVVVVENGEDAVKMAHQEKFDLILMDMQMPIMNGFEATEKIREIPEYREIPIIALTAFAMKGDREKCLESGATDYIPKPIDSKEFIDKVKYYTNVST